MFDYGEVRRFLNDCLQFAQELGRHFHSDGWLGEDGSGEGRISCYLLLSKAVSACLGTSVNPVQDVENVHDNRNSPCNIAAG